MHQTVSRLRPLRLRLANTLRPPTVEFRLRKPCVRFLRIFLGWYVRFMVLFHLAEIAWAGANNPKIFSGFNLAPEPFFRVLAIISPAPALVKREFPSTGSKDSPPGRQPGPGPRLKNLPGSPAHAAAKVSDNRSPTPF